jgi:hypothetical protein
MATAFSDILISETARINDDNKGECKCVSGSSIRINVFSTISSTIYVIDINIIWCPELRLSNISPNKKLHSSTDLLS